MKTLRCIAAMIALTAVAAAESPSAPKTVLLTLAGGADKTQAWDFATHDMELELVRRGGAFEPKVWGFAEDLGYGDHEGQVITQKDGRLEIEMVLNQPLRAPDFRRRFGVARYSIALSEKDGAYSGTYTGTVTIEFPAPRAGQSNVREVSGKLTGKTWPCWTEPRPGFKPLAPKEHPRLIFRKHDLPMLRERMKTPEGQAIMDRMKTQLSRTNNNPSFDAAGWAVAYQLTGDAKMADKAREAISPALGQTPSTRYNMCAVAVTMALALDNCYDVWNPEFRQQVMDKLNEWRRFLSENPIQTTNPIPWKETVGGAPSFDDMRAAGLTMAAICLLGETTSDGQSLADVERIVQCGGRAVRRHFQHNLTSNTGYPLEYWFHLWLMWNIGPGHVIQAYRTALGGDPMAGWPGRWTMLAEWMREPPSADLAGRETIAKAKAIKSGGESGFYPTAWVTVPDSMKAGTRWLYDRAFGLEGTKTMGIFWPYHAGYVLMNYPFDIHARPPSESLPWMAPDPTGGHWIFRKPWQGKDDNLILVNPRNDLRRKAGHYTGNPNWDITLWSQGRKWMGLRTEQYNYRADLPGCALPLIGEAVHREFMSRSVQPQEGGNYKPNPDGAMLNNRYSARCLDYRADDRGKASLSFDLSPIYMRSPVEGEVIKPDQRVFRGDRWALLDLGIRGRRDLAIDLTGDSGAPVLMAIMDRFENAKDLVWRLILDTNAGPAQVAGNTVTVGDPAAENLRVTFVSPKTPILTGEITAKGGEEYFVVITVQKGKAPEMKTEGEGLTAKVTVGGQPIQLDGERLVIGNLNTPVKP